MKFVIFVGILALAAARPESSSEESGEQQGKFYLYKIWNLSEQQMRGLKNLHFGNGQAKPIFLQQLSGQKSNLVLIQEYNIGEWEEHIGAYHVQMRQKGLTNVQTIRVQDHVEAQNVWENMENNSTALGRGGCVGNQVGQPCSNVTNCCSQVCTSGVCACNPNQYSACRWNTDCCGTMFCGTSNFCLKKL